MKKTVLYIFLLLPVWVSAQLFPKVPELKGNIKKIVEKRYGKELNAFRKDSGVFRPGAFSGWKYTFLFDENGKPLKRTNTFQGKVRTTYSYQTEITGHQRIDREKVQNYSSREKTHTIEYENLTDQQGLVRKVNFWYYPTPESTKILFLFETNAVYEESRLTAFTRHNIKLNGDTASGENCHLYYDHLGRLTQIERQDIASGFKTVICYHFNEKGLINHYSIDLLAEMKEYGKEQIQNVYFRYDRRGNWNRMYWKSGKKNILEARRSIRYR